MTSAALGGHGSMGLMQSTVTEGDGAEGHAPANGVQMYWRSLGQGGTPLVVVHGGFRRADMLGPLAQRSAAGRRVISVELQGHGHTPDADRPFSYEAFGDDLAALVRHLDLGPV